jgi:hypothetical protein
MNSAVCPGKVNQWSAADRHGSSGLVGHDAPLRSFGALQHAQHAAAVHAEPENDAAVAAV